MSRPPSEESQNAEPAAVPFGPMLRRAAPYRAQLLQGLVLLLLTNALDKSIPMLLKGAVDALTVGQVTVVQGYALGVVGLAAGMALVRTYSRIRIFNVARDIEFDLRDALLAQLQKLGPAFFQRMPTGETMSRAINDLAQVRAFFGFGLLNLVNSTLAYAVALTFMLGMSPALTGWALLPYPLLIACGRWVGRVTYTKSRQSQEALGELSGRVQETLSGIRLIRAYAAEREQYRRFEQANEEALRTNMALVVVRGLMWPLLIGVSSLGTLMVLWKGTQMVQGELLSVGELVAFVAYSEALKWPTMGLGYILAVVQRGRASYARVLEILDAVPEVQEQAGARPPGQEGALRLDELSYAYDGRKVLDGVSLELEAGSSLAVVGRTGSGKSTLAALLPRLLPTPPGTVFVDGDDITELQLRPLRRAVGFAQQDPFLFSDTIAHNIGYRFDDPDTPEAMAEIRDAAAQVAVLDEIESLPDGMGTVVGERGVQLSGGQKQRIALARALLNRPRVLVMDDPLSAVDAKTEAKILEALERAGRDRTVVLITNRVAAAARCERVIVLDEGRVVQRGSHAELVRADGLYARLAARQRLEAELRDL
ncbi:MAG: ABC transporter ATP-binding protein/permease [Myxococcales bacterium]|nr:ABC transporter ATP-binding protein/permease [Myxococcales bacterium]